MRQIAQKILFDHPASVDEGYFEHMSFASKFAFGLFIAGGAAIVHAVIPCLCEKTASNKIKELYGKIHNRNNAQE